MAFLPMMTLRPDEPFYTITLFPLPYPHESAALSECNTPTDTASLIRSPITHQLCLFFLSRYICIFFSSFRVYTAKASAAFAFSQDTARQGVSCKDGPAFGRETGLSIWSLACIPGSTT